jgi:hypothetical protein
MAQGTRSAEPGFAFTRTAEHHARTLVAGSIAGMVFGVLFGVCVAIIRTKGGQPDDTGAWLARGTSGMQWALALLPFAGIFFLWFIGVSRQRLGRWEDRFISTIILGSGLLFLAMVFAAAGLAGALLAMYAKDPVGFPGSETYTFIQFAVAKIFGVYALRMAAVFLFCQATAWLRHGLMPKWLALPSYAVALVLLFMVSEEAWAVLIFPVWIFVISAYLFVTTRRVPEEAEVSTPRVGADEAGGTAPA